VTAPGRTKGNSPIRIHTDRSMPIIQEVSLKPVANDPAFGEKFNLLFESPAGLAMRERESREEQ
jgi:hypothetical protein